jgi:3-hydroxybutyrate dehydrogenase
MIELMLTAPFLLASYAWSHLKASGRGRMINLGNVLSLKASPFKVADVAVKRGLIGLTKVTVLEGVGYGIPCNTICPGFVRTPLTEYQIADQVKISGISSNEVETHIFLGRAAIQTLLEPEGVARLLTVLASERSWGATGSVKTIDLGWTAG